MGVHLEAKETAPQNDVRIYDVRLPADRQNFFCQSLEQGCPGDWSKEQTRLSKHGITYKQDVGTPRRVLPSLHKESGQAVSCGQCLDQCWCI